MLSTQIVVKVIPLSSKNSIEKVSGFDYDYKIKVSAPPVHGRANEQVIELIADYLGTKKSNISIIKGEKNNIKLLSIAADVY